MLSLTSISGSFFGFWTFCTIAHLKLIWLLNCKILTHNFCGYICYKFHEKLAEQILCQFILFHLLQNIRPMIFTYLNTDFLLVVGLGRLSCRLALFHLFVSFLNYLNHSKTHVCNKFIALYLLGSSLWGSFPEFHKKYHINVFVFLYPSHFSSGLEKQGPLWTKVTSWLKVAQTVFVRCDSRNKRRGWHVAACVWP